MYLTKKNKEDLFKKHGKDAKDTGSAEGQIALFTHRINHLTEHLKSCLLYTSPSPRDVEESRMPSSA